MEKIVGKILSTIVGFVLIASFVFAAEPRAWHNAEDIKPGTFGYNWSAADWKFTGGKVGINKTGTPASALDVNGVITGSGSGLTNLNANNLAAGTIPSARLSGTYGISISGNAAGTATALAADGANCAFGQYAQGVNASGVAQGCTALTSSQWTTSGSNIYYTTGNVGIGMTNPTVGSRIHVAAAPSSIGAAIFTTNDWDGANVGTGLSIAFGATSGNTYGAIHVATAGGGNVGHLILLPYGGNVGIGTTVPKSKLDVAGSLNLEGRTDPSSGNSLNLGYDTTYNVGYVQATTYGVANRPLVLGGGSIKFATISSGDISTGTANVRMVIDGSGNVGIGSGFTSPAASLQVGPDVLVSASGSTQPQLTMGGSTSFKIRAPLAGQILQNWLVITNVGSYADLFALDNAGNIWIAGSAAQKNGGGTWADYSDIRLKENIKPLNNALGKITQLQGVEFNWNKISGRNGSGVSLIAQDVEKVFPEWVGVDSKGYKTLTFPNEFNAYIIESIKEQQQQIEQLKSIVCKDHPEAEVCKK